MQARDGVFLEDLCPKLGARRWRQTLHELTAHRCLYCGAASESIDHVFPRSRGGISSDDNCVPACLDCNGDKGDSEAFHWYRSQPFYDPRRAMALRAWVEGDRLLAQRLLSWAAPASTPREATETALRNRKSRLAERAGRGETVLNSAPTAACCPDMGSQGSQRQPQDQEPTGPQTASHPAAEPAASLLPERRQPERQQRRRAGRTDRDPGGNSVEHPGTPSCPPAHEKRPAHQTRQASAPLWRWQMAS